MAKLGIFLKSVNLFIPYRKKKANNPIKYFKNCFKKFRKKQTTPWLQRKFRGVIAFWTPS